MNCLLCDRENLQISKHHLIPRSRHNKRVKRKLNEEMLNLKMNLCRPCHDQIHTVFTEKQLEQLYNDPIKIKFHPEISKFISWIKNKPINFRLKVVRPAK
jgi:hypothetical protein